MIPFLFDSSETSFTTQGLGRLVDCTRCIVTEERNGIYELEFDYPITGSLFERLKQGGIVACTHDDNGDLQPFDLYRYSAPLAGIVTFYAHHISYRLGNITVKPFTATSCATALTGIKTNSMITNPFTFGTDKAVSTPFQTTVPKIARAMLGGEEGSILDVFGTGEYEFDKFSVYLHTNRGSDKGIQIRYGKNLSDLTDEVDTTSIFNAVAPYWQGQDGTVVLPEGYVSATAPSGVTVGMIIKPLDLSGDFADKPTVAQLRTAAQSYVNRNAQWYAQENISVDFVALWQTPEYERFASLEQVGLCDTVTVIYEALGIQSKQKVVKVVYNVLLDAYDSMELGQLGTTLSAALTGSLAGTVQTIQNQIQNIQDTFVTSVNGQSGDVVLDASDIGALAIEGGTAIPDNADLNDYTTVGNFYCNTNTSAQSIANGPSGMTRAFTLTVDVPVGVPSSSVVYRRQTLRPYDLTEVWQRMTKNGGTSWTAWSRDFGITASDVGAVPTENIRTFTHNASQTRSYNVPSGSGHLVIATGPGSGQKGMYLIQATNAGAVSVATVLAGGNMTLTPSTNTLNITNGLSSSQAFVTFIRLRGGVVTAS